MQTASYSHPLLYITCRCLLLFLVSLLFGIMFVLLWVMLIGLHMNIYCRNFISSVKTDSVSFHTSNLSQPVPTCAFNRRSPNKKISVPLKQSRLLVLPNTSDGHPSASAINDEINLNNAPNGRPETILGNWSPPKYLWRGLTVPIIAGQVIMKILKGKIHWRNCHAQNFKRDRHEV